MPGMVTSPHPLASHAGAEVLRRGGNAAEAAVAMGAVLTVVMPHFCGLGGDAVWMLADRDGLETSILGIGQAPQVLPDLDGPLPMRGVGSMLTTACAVDSWDQALNVWGGGMDFADLIAPAIALARNGFTPSRSQDFWLDFRAADWPAWPGFAGRFDHRSSDGPLRQPELADMLTLIACDGPRSFYDGQAADRVAQGLADLGAAITSADLAATRSRRCDPVALDYRGLRLLAPPPPTQGITTLAIMGILAQLDAGDPTHRIVEAVKQAFLDRHLIADPDMVPVDCAALLSPARLQAKAAAIRPDHALDWPQPFQHGDTVFLAARDDQGRCASLLQSTFFDWGSGVVVGDTGIIWQNRGAGFSTVPGHPNCIAPGKRPFYTLNPGIAMKDGAPHLLYGTQGADGQPQTLAVILSALIDRGMMPAEALAQPRFLLGRTFSDSGDSLKLEASHGSQMVAGLRDLGHQVSELPALSPIFGCAGVIRIDDGDVSGAHDPRGEGVAIGTHPRP